MAELGFPVFDADHHYYEAEDAFTRHVDRRMQNRCMQWAEINGRKRLLVGGKTNRFIPNPTFDPVAQPGILDAQKVRVSPMRSTHAASLPSPCSSAASRKRRGGSSRGSSERSKVP